MRTIHTYIMRDYLITFALTILVFTFVMSLGAVVKAIELISRGVSDALIFKVFLWNIPYTMTFSIPISALTTVLLMYGRLSMDGEITAMRASGISLWQVISSSVVVSVLLSCACIFINNRLAPDSHYARREVVSNLGIIDPVTLIEEGEFIRDFPGLLLFVGKKNENKIKDVVVYELDQGKVKRYVRAKHGEIRPQDDNRIIMINLFDVRIDQPDPEDPMNPALSHYVTADKYPVKLDFSKMINDGKLRKKVSDMRFSEIVRNVKTVRELYPEMDEGDLQKQRMNLLVAGNKRFALAFSCFSFTLLGIPLGMKSKRKESSIGIAISIGLVFVFYLFIIIADSLVEHPGMHPELIVWIPVIVAEVVGIIMLRRIN